MKRKSHILVAAAVMLFASSALKAAAMETRSLVVPELKIRLESVGTWHALDIDNKAGNAPDMSTGFAAVVANLYIFATIADGIDIFTEYYLSSKHHLGDVYDNEGYVLIKHLPEQINVGPLEKIFEYVDLKGGHFEVDYGNQHWVRSDEGETQRNPLVGNHLVDPQLVEGGAELISHFGPVHLVAGMGNGVTSENFDENRNYSYHGKVLLEPESKKFNIAFSLYDVEHDSATVRGNLFSGMRSGSRYAGLNPATGASDADFGQLLLGRDQDMTAWQADAGVGFGPVWLSGLFGTYLDNDVNGSDPGQPSDLWTYFGAEAKVGITENAYLAARYSGADAKQISGSSSGANAYRIQAGYGYHLADGILFKLEYMNQKMNKFPTAAPIAGGAQNTSYTKYAGDVEISGVTMELSVAFGNAAPYEHSTSGWGTTTVE